MAPDVEREGRLDEIIASYLKAAENGSAPPRQTLLDSHPDLAAELADFFADQERVRRLAAPLRAAAPPAVRLPRLRDFGDYEIQEEIARGGMGVVFRAWQKNLNRVVALKMLLAGPLASPDDVRRFRAEAEAAARLDHPHIVPIYDVGVHDGHPYLSMKLLKGGSLAQAARPTPRDAARLLASVADAVHYAHQRGVLHRDLKPANILLDDGGRPYVTDFGLAKQTWAGGVAPAPASRGRERPEDGISDRTVPPVAHAPRPPVPTVLLPPATQTGAVVGTPAYMAPEQASGRRDAVTTAADVYGLGAVLYELLTGRPPFRGETPVDTLRLVHEAEAMRPRALNAAVDRDLETICLKCLEKEPARRYAAAADLAADLRRYLAGESIRARPAGPVARLARTVRRHPVVAALVVALVVALSAGLAASTALWRRAEVLYASTESQKESLAGQTIALRAALGQAHAAEEKAKDEARTAEEKTKEADAHFRQAHEVVSRLRQMSDELGKVPGTQPLRRRLLQTVLEYYRDFVNQRDDPALRRERADAQFDAAEIVSDIGSRDDALAAFRRAADLYGELHDADPADPELRRRYINSLNNAGTHEQNIEASMAVFRQVRRLYEEELCFRPDDEALLNGLANALSNLGACCLDSGRFGESRRCLDESIEIQEGLLKKSPFRITFTHDLATTYTNLGTLNTRLPGKAEEALRAYERARDLHQKLADALPKEPQRRADLAASLNSIGILLRDHGDKDEALKVLLRADAVRQKVADENPSVGRFQVDLALSHGHVGVAYARTGDPVKALTYYEKGRDLLDKLHRQDPKSLLFRKELGVAWYNIGACHGAAGRPKEEYEAFVRARDLQEPVVREDPDNVNCRFDLGRTLTNLGLSLHRQGREDEARDVLRSGVAAIREGLERSPQAADGLTWLLNGLYVNLSLVERSAGRAEDALAVTRERLELCANNADELYRGALEYAATASLFGGAKEDPAPEEQAGRDRCADLALDALRRAVARGFHDADRLRKDREWDLLRPREDYRALLAALEGKK